MGYNIIRMEEQQSFEKSPCRVCLEANANASIDGCDHLFCLRCIRKWSKRKNTCPLCRAEFLLIRRSRKIYKVTPPPPPPPRQRASLQNSLIPVQLQQRRIIYLPVLFGAHPLCYFFTAAGSGIGNQNMMMPRIGQPIAFPSFFIPN